MRVVFLEPGKEAYVDEIDSSLKAMQAAVGGYIEPIYGFPEDENLCIVGNEAAKMEENWRVSRVLRDEAGNIYDVLAGRAFVCAVDDENFIGLNDDQIQTVMASYRYPEHVLMISSGLVALPYPEPEIDAEFEMEFE